MGISSAGVNRTDQDRFHAILISIVEPEQRSILAYKKYQEPSPSSTECFETSFIRSSIDEFRVSEFPSFV